MELRQKMGSILILLISSHFVFSQTSSDNKNDHVMSLSSIIIEGSTNLNSFYFTYNKDKEKSIPLPETFKLISYDSDIIRFNIPVKAFKGSIPDMEDDFQTLLKSSIYPNISVGVEKNYVSKITYNKSDHHLNLYLTLAGKTKTIIATYSTQLISENKIIINGVTQVDLSDFDMTPPVKFFGILRVKNLVTIKFDIITETKPYKST